MPQHRLMLRTLLRVLLNMTVLVILYYLLPLDRKADVVTGLTLAGGLVVFAGVISLQIRRIARSDHPRLRALEALAASLPLFLLIFATAYFVLAHGNAGSFTEPLSRTDALYFTITVFSTVGFGDIAPVTETARIIAMIQMIGDLIIIGVIARIFLNAVTAGLQRRSSEETSSDREPAGGSSANARSANAGSPGGHR